MKKLFSPNVLFVSAMFTLCAIAVGCGSSATYPRQLSASVQGTANPLVAQFTVSSPCPGQAMVEFGTDTTYGRSTAWYPAFADSQTQILVAGMKASTTYHMRSQLQCPDGLYPGNDLTFTTGPLPSSLTFPTLTVTRPNPSSSSPENPGVESLAITTPGVPFMVTDRDGNPIWYYDAGAGATPYMFKLLSNGHMLVMIITGGVLTPTTSVLREIDLAGNLIRQLYGSTLSQEMASQGFDFQAQNFSHDFAPLPNGHVIALVNFSKTVTATGYGTLPVVGDGVVDLDENWNPVWAWNSFDYLDINRHLEGLPDWTHGNAVLYSPEDGNILVSFRHQSWILKLNYANGTGPGNIIWHLGYQGDFALTNNGVPTDDATDWFSFQHFPSIISQNGSKTMLNVWDNGDNRVIDANGDVCEAPPLNVPCYSRATSFQVDESAMVADLQWSDLPGDFSLWGGSINQLENGNVEFDINAPTPPPIAGLASQIREVTQTSTPQIVWQMNINTDNAYRGYRIPSLYPNVTWQY
jgi:arylsulfate sulfotransferase